MLRSRHPHRVALVAVSLILAGVAGCGKPTVSGSVSLDGKQVDGGSISFVPEGTDTAAPAVAAEIKDGKYTVPGGRLAPGKYKVVIDWKQKTGKKIPYPATRETRRTRPSRSSPPSTTSQRA